MDSLIAPQLRRYWNSPNWMKVSFSCAFGLGNRVLTVAYATVYVPDSSSEYPPFEESLVWVLESIPTEHSFILSDFNAHVGSDTIT